MHCITPHGQPLSLRPSRGLACSSRSSRSSLHPLLLLLLLLPLARLVKRAMHGTRMMSWQEIRELYGREVVNLRNEGRWVFLNTLFSVSEAVMYMQARRGGFGGVRGFGV